MSARVHSFLRRDHRLVRRLASHLLAATVLVAAIAAGNANPAAAEPTKPSSHRPGILRATTTATTTTTGSDPTRVGAAATVEPALPELNGFRNRVGVHALGTPAATQSAVAAHANYLELNKSDPDLVAYEEIPGKPGYTTAGAEIAPFTVAVVGAASSSIALDIAMADPYSRSMMLLSPRAASVAFASSPTFRVIGVTVTTEAVTTTWPKVYPVLSNHRGLSWDTTSEDFYTSTCSQTPTVWGYPITVQLDDTRYSGVSGARVSLTEDGRGVDTCVVTDPAFTGVDGQVVVVPVRPLRAGAFVEGRLTGTALARVGADQPLNVPIRFNTWAASSAGGDQSGDGVAELMGVDATGTLQMFKGARGAGFGARWAIGGGWGTTRWVAHVPDLNGDRRDELLSVRSDGTMWLYLGVGMGQYQVARKVGWGWQNVTNITVVGDMTGDGRPEVVAVQKNGDLSRYSLTASGFTSTNTIAKNWQGLRFLTGVGDLNRDGNPDVVAVVPSGELRAYYSRGGGFVQAAKVGQGWGSWTQMFTPGDISGDGIPDLVGRDSAGTMFSWTTGKNAFLDKRQVGVGFGGYRLFA
ncbi:FG-GAP repeat domain-containing protein [Aestuariimicrobium soli]|uniref:FG-GAP repeat domain-containing protein n=1 Tax=Aestuariimicrobium soli TaxID=2035834 RepID=UPI003EC0B57E